MPYQVYAIPGVNSWWRHGEIEKDYLAFCSQLMIEMQTRMREMGGEEGNDLEKLGVWDFRGQVNWPFQIWHILLPIQWVISGTWGILYSIRLVLPLISHISCIGCIIPIFSPQSLFIVHKSTIFTESRVKSSLSIYPCHNHEIIPIVAYPKYRIHQVQHIPSTVYTTYSIHTVQHTPSISYTQ